MGQEVRFGHHRFDRRTGQLWAGRREVKLTPRAAAVLAALIDRAGEPVTRDELFQIVWKDTVVGDAALTACIQELRDALEDDARRSRFIETRHRRGYRFVARIVTSAAERMAGDSPRRAKLARPVPALAVGRDRELAELRACLARATNGERQVVFVSGEPGIGKTTTVETFLAEAAGGSPARIAQGRCIETHGAGEAYFPLLEAMTRLCREPGGPRIVRLLRQHAPTWLAEMPSVVGPPDVATIRRQTAGVTRQRMLRELAEAVEIAADELPLVLWLEDLHWSDPSTLDWLAYMAKRPGPARVLILGSYRTGGALPRGHPLEAVRDDLKVHGHCHDIALAPLDRNAVDEYLARRFPSAGPLTELADLIHGRTGGNPLFVVNVADDLVRRGVLIERAARWEVAGPVLTDIVVPEDVHRLIGHELDGLTSDQRQILEAASAAGVEFSAASVAASMRLDLDTIEPCCAELARRASFLTSLGVDTWRDGTVAGRYGFRHALYQQVVYDRIPAGRRSELHRRIGERLETGLAEQAATSATELAMHFERGGDASRAVRYLRFAGEIATQRSATREAVGHLTRALELLGTQPDTPQRAEQEVALQIALGGPLMAMKGRGAPEVERAYTRAQELCQRIDDPRPLFRALWGLFLFRRSRGEIAVAQQLGERLLALAQHIDDDAFVIQAHHALWAARFAGGELMTAREHVARAVSLYDRERHASLAAVYGNHDAAVCALGHGAWALELCGESEQASRQSEAAVALARALGHAFSEAHALLYGARVHQFRGDWRTTLERADAAAVLARDHGFVQLDAWAAVTGGWALAEAGDVERGLATMRDGVATLRALGSQEFATYFLALLVETTANASQRGEALEIVGEALAAVERTGERFYAAELHRLRGEALLASGRHHREVAECFATALDIARHQRALALERRVLRSLGKVSDPDSVARASTPSLTGRTMSSAARPEQERGAV